MSSSLVRIKPRETGRRDAPVQVVWSLPHSRLPAGPITRSSALLQAGGLSRPMPFLLSIWYYQWQSSVKRFLAAGSHRNCVNPSGFSWFYKRRRSFGRSDWRFRSNPA